MQQQDNLLRLPLGDTLRHRNKKTIINQIRCSQDNKRIATEEAFKAGSSLLQASLPHSLSSLHQPDIYFNSSHKYNYMKDIIDKYFDDGKKDKDVYSSCLKAKASITKRNYEAVHVQTLPLTKRSLGGNAKTDRSRNTCSKQKVNRNGNILHDNKFPETKINNETIEKTFNVMLPPIDESFQDKDDADHHSLTQRLDQYVIFEQSESRILFEENEIYVVYIVFVHRRPSYKLKKFKERGYQILRREQRALSMGMNCLWRQCNDSETSLACPLSHSLKSKLFRIRHSGVSILNEAKQLLLVPRRLYWLLLSEQNVELIRLVRDFCREMSKAEGKIINNKINIDNMYVDGNGSLVLGQWGYSTFREFHCIQNRGFESQKQPILKSVEQWFVMPEYLAPEIVSSMVRQEDTEIVYSPASDVWSLGLAIFQMLTLIPVWATQKCSISQRCVPPRTGVLATADKDLTKLHRKQLGLRSQLRKILAQEGRHVLINPRLQQLIWSMLDMIPANRPTFGEIARVLQ